MGICDQTTKISHKQKIHGKSQKLSLKHLQLSNLNLCQSQKFNRSTSFVQYDGLGRRLEGLPVTVILRFGHKDQRWSKIKSTNFHKNLRNLFGPTLGASRQMPVDSNRCQKEWLYQPQSFGKWSNEMLKKSHAGHAVQSISSVLR